MGHIRHHTVVVTSLHDDLLDEARSKAVELFEAQDMVQLVSPIVFGMINGYNSFFVAPDGSKEFWDTSNEAEQARTAFVDWLEEKRHDDGSSSIAWVEVQFHDDDGVVQILRHDDEKRKR